MFFTNFLTYKFSERFADVGIFLNKEVQEIQCSKSITFSARVYLLISFDTLSKALFLHYKFIIFIVMTYY